MVIIRIGKYTFKTFDIVIFSVLIFIYILTILIETPPLAGLKAWISNLSSSWNDMAQLSANALLMAFIFSMFGNTSVLIVFPYALIVWNLCLANPSLWLPLGIISGLGAGIGEVTSYLVGLGIGKSKKVQASEIGEKFLQMKRKFEKKPKLIPATVFIFALTPLPDDIILVPFGIMHYPYYKVITPCMLGKMCMCTIICLFAFLVKQHPTWEHIFPISLFVPSEGVNPAQDLISFSMIFWVIWIMVKLDFEKLGIQLSKEREKDLVTYLQTSVTIPMIDLETMLQIQKKDDFEIFIKELASKNPILTINNEIITRKQDLSKQDAEKLSISIFQWMNK